MKKQNLKAAATFMVLMLVTCLSTPSAHGTVTPKREKIVAADGSGDYTTITAALSAINATAQAPYVIKVRPGNYPEAVTMKSYISLEGDGPETTTITTSTSPTVNMVDNTTIRNIKVQNTTSGPRTGLSFTGGTAAAENVVVESLNGTDNDRGVSITGGSKVELRNITVNIIAGNVGMIELFGIYNESTSQVAILNSNIYVDGNGGPAYPEAVADLGVGTMSIRDSVIEATNGTSGVYALQCNSNTTVTGSKILASKINNTLNRSAAIEGPCKIMSSEIRATNLDLTNAVVNWNLGGGQQIGGSLIQGSIDYSSQPGKTVNCWDENFNPIPNY